MAVVLSGWAKLPRLVKPKKMHLSITRTVSIESSSNQSTKLRFGLDNDIVERYAVWCLAFSNVVALWYSCTSYKL